MAMARLSTDCGSAVMAPSVVTYALDRLADLGIGHVFGVPGDYAFPLNDAVGASTAAVGSVGE